jgi:hypothetical protein
VLIAGACFVILRSAARKYPTAQTKRNGQPDRGRRSLSPIAALPPKDAASFSLPSNLGLVEFWDAPGLGRIQGHVRPQIVHWRDPAGKDHEFPFRFLYGDNGIWFRAVYTHGKNVNPEWPPDAVDGLYSMRGEAIVGMPERNPQISFEEILSKTYERVHFESATQIIVEHVLYETSDDFPKEPVIMVNIWGAGRAWADRPSSPQKIRLLFGLDSHFTFYDDAL